MGARHLKLVDTDLDGRCGARTLDGTPCMRKTGGERCWDHPDSPAAGPPPPEYLGDYGKEEWNRRMEELGSVGLCDQIDLGLLESLCDVYDELRSAKEDLDRRGREIPGRGDTMKKNPALSVWNRCRKEYRLHAKDLRAQVESLLAETGEGDSSKGDAWAW